VWDPKTRFVWRGEAASEACFEAALKLAKRGGGKVVVAQQRMEPPTFWKMLGGKKGKSENLRCLFCFSYFFFSSLQSTFKRGLLLRTVRRSG
jgi:hypothetical protein